MAKIPLSQRIRNELMAPIGFFNVLGQIVSMPLQKNCIKRSSECSEDERRTIRISKDISIKKIKKVSKKHGATITEICHTVTGLSINEYAKAKGDNNL